MLIIFTFLDIELHVEDEEKINIEEYENADLFLSYIDKNLNKKHLFYIINNVEQFSICKKEDLIIDPLTINSSASNNKKNITNKIKPNSFQNKFYNFKSFPNNKESIYNSN